MPAPLPSSAEGACDAAAAAAAADARGAAAQGRRAGWRRRAQKSAGAARSAAGAGTTDGDMMTVPELNVRRQITNKPALSGVN